jgi:anaerobic magnesium-protoporphyrin IX monomethyl ester cyclase
MRILFIVSDIFIGEPIGVMQLSAVLKQAGHATKLVSLKKHSLQEALNRFNPHAIAYSAMSPDVPLFRTADKVVRDWADNHGHKLLRIAGGPHPTFFPEFLTEMDLDAICIGEGDRAIREIMRRYQNGQSLAGIVNVMTPGDKLEDIKKELIEDLGQLPYIDRDIYYEAMPIYRSLRMRGFMVGRGCPYGCTYCHNHAFKEIFKGCGKIVRRRPVDNVIDEMKQVVAKYGPVKLLKISDDTFSHNIDSWLLEFIEKYRKEIRLPFYCLMRSNTLSEEMAKQLKSAGCVSIGMSVESGDEEIRNKLLNRGLTDKIVINSFKYARKYGISTYGNTLLALPGTNFEDDYKSFLFTKKLKMTAPTFGVFNPYPKLALTDMAIEKGYLDPDYEQDHVFGNKSPLKYLTDEEKEMQLRLSYLGPLFSDLPDVFLPLFRRLLRINGLFIYKPIGYAYLIIKTGLFIFPKIYPYNPFIIIKVFVQSLKFFTPKNQNSEQS